MNDNNSTTTNTTSRWSISGCATARKTRSWTHSGRKKSYHVILYVITLDSILQYVISQYIVSQYSIVYQYIIVYYTILHYAILTILYFTILQYSILDPGRTPAGRRGRRRSCARGLGKLFNNLKLVVYYITLHYIISYYIISYYITLYSIVQYSILLCRKPFGKPKTDI